MLTRSVLSIARESLTSLITGLQYLLHWPQVVDWPDDAGALGLLRQAYKLFQGGKEAITVKDSPSFSETWKGMEAVYRKGKARNIGVSNFSVKT